MTWWTALPTTLATVAVFWGPGAGALALLGCRGLLQAALAPAVTALMFGVAALLCPTVGVVWGVLPAMVVTATVLGGLHLLVRRRAGVIGPTWPDDPASARWRWLVPAALVAAVAAQAGPVVAGMQRPDRVQNAWDALFHVAALRQVRAGGGADAGAFEWLLGDGAVYPQAWHAVAGLAPAWGGPVLVTNVAALLPCILATALGTAAAARAIFRDDRIAAAATLMLGCGVALPVSIALQPGLIPNAFGLALVPGALAAVVEATRRGPGAAADRRRAVVAGVVVGVVVGIAVVHPGAAAALGLVAAPWWVPAAVRAARHAWARPWPRAVTVAIAVASGLGVAAVLTSPTYRGVVSTRTKEPEPLRMLVIDLATGNLGEWPSYAIAPTVLAAAGAAVLLRLHHSRPPAIALVLAVVAYVSAAATWEPLAPLATFWYVETRRVAPVVGLLTALVAGWALVAGARELATRLESTGRRSAGAIVAGLVAAISLVAALPATATATGLAEDTFSQSMPDDPQLFDRKPYVTPAEEAMLGRLADVLDPADLLLGSSLAGAGHLAALTGQRVQQPYHSIAMDDFSTYVSEHLADLDDDPQVCAAVRALDARYVYVDPYPMHSTYWTTSYLGAFTQAPPLDALDAGGTAAVYSLDVCYAADPPGT